MAVAAVPECYGAINVIRQVKATNGNYVPRD